MGAAALLAFRRILQRCPLRLAIVTVPDRDAVSPPQLAADAPVADVFQPVVVDFGEPRGHDADAPIAHRLQRRVRQGLDAHEPLRGEHGLHHRVAALAVAQSVIVWLSLEKLPAGFQIAQQCFAGLVAIHARVGPRLFVERGVPVHDVDHRQVVALAHLVVAGIVPRRDLHRAGAEGRVHVFVGDDGDAAAQRRQDGRAPDQGFVALVVGMHGHGGIPQDRLRPRGGDLDVSATLQEIAHRPQIARRVLVFHLQVRDGGHAVRAPVDELAAVDQPPFVQAHEGGTHSAAQPLIHGKPLSLPVAGGAQPAMLLGDDAAVVFLPGPAELHEPIPSQVHTAQPLTSLGQREADLSQQVIQLALG